MQEAMFMIILSNCKPAATTLLCDIAVDESMVEAYNAANNTSYKMMPAFVYELQAKNAIVKAGQQESNSLSVKFSSLFGLVEGEEYLLPIVATIDETCVGQFVTDTRSVSYFTISIDGELGLYTGIEYEFLFNGYVSYVKFRK